VHETVTSFTKDFAFHIYLPIPASVMMNATYKAAFYILLFDMKIDNAGSCTALLALLKRFRAVLLSLR